METLAALLVIAVGFIGIAALYSQQSDTPAETDLHRQAAALARTMAARIRDSGPGRAGYATTIGVLCKPQSAPVLALDVAAQEAACWEDEVGETLPSGLGTVTRDPSTSPVSYVVAVSWSAPESGAASYVLRVTPKTPEIPLDGPPGRAAPPVEVKAASPSRADKGDAASRSTRGSKGDASAAVIRAKDPARATRAAS